MFAKNDIAIIYFSRTSEFEAEKKQWYGASSRKQNLAISNFLQKRARSIALKSSLQVLNFDESKQKGDTFGEKISNAFSETFELGFSAAICIGNDCIDLDLVDWQNVISKLQQQECVVGPSYRNGAYLIGLTKHNFNNKAFETLRWQTEYLADDLLGYFEGQCFSVEVLATLRDANNISDFKQLVKSLRIGAEVIKNLKNFISFEVRFLAFNLSIFIQQRFFNFENLRAPPAG